MNFVYRLLLQRFARAAMQKPIGFMALLLLLSGAIRGWAWSILGLGQPSEGNFLVELLIPQAANKDSMVRLLTALAKFFLESGISLVGVGIVCWYSCRLAVDLQGYTKALFWSITREYEHNVSRAEAIILLALPGCIASTVVAPGFSSLASWVLTGMCLNYHRWAYHPYRLKQRTDEAMKARSSIGWSQPPDS